MEDAVDRFIESLKDPCATPQKLAEAWEPFCHLSPTAQMHGWLRILQHKGTFSEEVNKVYEKNVLSLADTQILTWLGLIFGTKSEIRSEFFEISQHWKANRTAEYQPFEGFQPGHLLFRPGGAFILLDFAVEHKTPWWIVLNERGCLERIMAAPSEVRK